jgi:hypothetical protein
MTKFSPLFAIPLLLVSSAFAAAPFEVKDTQGHSLTIDLIAVDGANVTFSTAGKEHTLTLDRFDDPSQAKIKEAGKDLPPQRPKLDIDISVSNKRQKVGYYKATQTISQKMLLKNLSPSIAYPASKGYIVSIGHDREYKDHYKILATSSFDISVPANKTFEQTTVPFSTTYDAENKGSGNLGGYEYESYVFVITDPAGAVLVSKSLDAYLRVQLEKDTSLAKKIITLKKDQLVDKNMEPSQDH